MSVTGEHVLLVATGNPGKLREFAELLSPLGWRCESLADRAAAGHAPIPEPEENGRTFLDNACLKASAYARASGCWTLADDSGLVVDALGGEPGVHSAYFARQHGVGTEIDDRATRDAANNRLLLERMTGVPEGRRGARFVCVLALADPAGRIALTASGQVEGEILREARGTGGFGYDPLFCIRSLGRTTAQLSSAEKHAVSHRGEATRRMVAAMTEVGLHVGEGVRHG